MNAIYNEIEPFACSWLERLIAAGHISPGVVERRSIVDLTPADVAGYGQRHFFAGIGVWSAALRLAGVHDDADIWTGSCPCQPFSDAGTRSGVRDARHLWPTWFELIRECRPAVVFGEQVASRDGLGWLDVVRADLERSGYAFGASDLCAAGVGAPHIRQRLYFVAYANESDVRQRVHVSQREPRREVPDAERRGQDGELAVSDGARLEGEGEKSRWWSMLRDRSIVGDAEAKRRGPRWWSGPHGRPTVEPQRSGLHDFWSDADWIPCTDGKSRPVEPGTFPLAHGAPARVGRLRGYGNAIVRQVAATFVRAALDAIGEA